MSRTGIIIFIVLVGAAGITTWLNRLATSEETVIEKTVNTADFFLKNFHLKQYTETGDFRYSIRGKHMEHFEENDTSIIQFPTINLLPEDSIAQWQVTARKAVALSRDLDEITLEGDVQINRSAAPGIEALQMKTDHLLVKPRSKYLSTAGEVTITSANSFISGNNLEADVVSGKYTLRNAKGHYVR